MEMVTLEMRMPKALAQLMEHSDPDMEFERNAMMLYPYVQNLTISHGRAAEILGVNKLDLIAFYCELGLPYLNQSVSDLEEELSAFHRSRRKPV